MQINGNALLVRCGQNKTGGQFRLNKGQGGADCLLMLFESKGSVRLQGKTLTVRPFTYMLVPFSDRYLSVQHTASVQWGQFQLSASSMQTLLSHGMKPGEVQALVQPLAVAAVWNILLSCAEHDTSLDLHTKNYAINLLLCLLLQNAAVTAEKAMQVPHYDKLAVLRSEIYSHPSEDWFIQDICDRLCISRPYFHKIYQAAFGTTCTQDVIDSRIAYAKTLLEDGEDAISEISQQCGFESDVYFMRQFKRRVGMTPTAYRRLCRQVATSRTAERAEEDG